MVDMAKKQILPAVEEYALEIAKTAAAKKEVLEGCACSYEKKLIEKLSLLVDQIATKTDELEKAILKLSDVADIEEESYAIRDHVLTSMAQLRAVCDEAETITSAKYWPFPTYGELLFGVK